MFKDKVIKYCNIFSGDKVGYYRLSNGIDREIYIRKGDNNYLKFVKFKFKNSWLKRLAYHILLTGIPQLFMKKIYLPSDTGEVILVGGQIKVFCLKDKKVYSFPHAQWDDEKFIKDKNNQILLGYKEFAPKMININHEVPFSVEELCEPYDAASEEILQKLFEFYDTFPGKIHGEFSRQQVVRKNGKILFVDWNMRDGYMIEDIKNLFR